jgi:hypothetical protein
MSLGNKCLIVVGIVFLAANGISATPEGDLRLGKMVDRLIEDPSGFPESVNHPRFFQHILDAATAGRAYPIDCLTPLAVEINHRHDFLEFRRGLVQRLGAPPELQSPEMIQVGDWLQVHYTTDISSPDSVDGWDANHNGIPDVVDRIAHAADSYYDIAVRRYGFLAPDGSGESAAAPWDIYLIRLPDPVHGLTLPPEWSASREAEGGLILLDPDELMRPESSGTIPHQLAHASLFAYSGRLPAWWGEASAVWLEKEITNDLTSHGRSVEARLRSPQTSLATDAVELLPGGYLWPLFLAEAHGDDPALIRRIWEQASDPDSGSVRAITDGILRNTKGVSFEAAFQRFAIWNSFTGRKDDGRHYRFGSHLPDPASPSLYETFPSVASPEDTTLAPLATRVITLEGRATRGGLDFHFFGQEENRWQIAALVGNPEHQRPSYFLDIGIDEMNRGRLRLPWDDMTRLTVFIQNLGSESDRDGHIGFTALHDPHYPFTLSGFGARGEQGQVVLEWATTAEQDLLGWNLYRSSDPLRGFSRVNRLLVPGGGDSREPTHYLFVDDAPAPGRQVYYYLEGITLEGFAQRSHIVGTRSLPSGRAVPARGRIPSP